MDTGFVRRYRNLGEHMELSNPLWSIPRNDVNVAMRYIESKKGQLSPEEWDVILSAQDDPTELLQRIYEAGYSDPAAYTNPHPQHGF